MFFGVSFSFKRYSFIRQISVFQFKKPVIIFNNVEEVKKDNKHFQLLAQMNFFVIDKYFIFLIFGFPNEDKGKESNAVNF